MSKHDLHVEFKALLNRHRIKSCRALPQKKHLHTMQVADVVHFILTEMNEEEVRAVVNMLKTITVHGGDIYGYFTHLAEGIPGPQMLAVRHYH